MLRSAFVLLMGVVGASVGLTIATAIQCDTFGCVLGPMAFGVIWGVLANGFLDDFIPNQRSIRRPKDTRTRPQSPPEDFQKRLSAFTNQATSKSVDPENDYRSSMPFWAAPYPPEPTPAKSGRFIRLILLRIRQILRS